ncbi:tripartite tricarboxylate transporter substrate-binding protein, partial [Tepidimonas sp.]|uniref:tripartite tricarboxylate transporter substrate-binding protein n=1 Tax=Tepidimonas sp. TaxID=2002775 RepID=UPI003FCE9EF9
SSHGNGCRARPWGIFQRPDKDLKGLMAALKEDPSKIVLGGAPVRVLAVYSKKRLTGRLSATPTAEEQGFDIQWPIIRGFYVGPKVSDADYQWWVAAFSKAMSAPGLAALQQQRGLFPFDMVGAELDRFVKERTRAYAELVKDFGLAK